MRILSEILALKIYYKNEKWTIPYLQSVPKRKCSFGLGAIEKDSKQLDPKGGFSGQLFRVLNLTC